MTREPDKTCIIKEWSGAKGLTYEKCPTLLKYEEDGSIKWGYELERYSPGLIEGVKLLLDPNQPKPIYVPEMDTTAVLKKLGKAPIVVVSEYLNALFSHAKMKIAAHYLPGYLASSRKQYVITVPAVWSDQAKDATLRVRTFDLYE